MRADRSTQPDQPILAAFAADPIVAALATELSKGERIAVLGSAGSSISFLAASIARQTKHPVLLVVAHPDEADEAADELTAAGVTALRLPALEMSPGESHVSLDLFAERLRVSQTFSSAPPEVLIAPVHALMQLLPAADTIKDSMRTVTKGDTLDPGDLLRWLDNAGYRRVDSVEEVGDCAVRGGIIDVFPPASITGDPVPVRIDFFGDEVDAICEIDPDTMGSDRALDSADLVGVSAEAMRSESAGVCVTSLLRQGWLAVMHEPIEIVEQARGYYERIIGDDGVLAPPDMLKRLQSDIAGVCEVSRYATPTASPESVFRLSAATLPDFSQTTREAIAELGDLSLAGPTIVYCQNKGEADRLGELLAEIAPRAPIDVRIQYVHRGFLWRENIESDTGADTTEHHRLAIVPHHELMHRYQARRATGRIRTGRSFDIFLDLEPGDYAVHSDHGVCRFVSLNMMKRRDSDAGEEEFLTLEFAKRTTLHVPIDQIDKVQRYVGGFHGKPKLSTLGSKRWKSQKDKVSEAVRDLASEMLRIQAARASLPGLRHPADTPWQQEFEAEFPYTETEDQLAAMSEIKRDMESPRPMDRLLCGDVGYGKTELAIRAAFKTAEFGKQVAILVPTTILAEQHERTFRERLADYPFRVESLSRFKSAGEQKKVLAELAAGRVDIIIGTHRLLSKDVQFADLGVVVVDEEQRFGVEHKQALLSLRMMVDVLTLSATPIPRTLHLSLLGLRDISSLATAPMDRRSVVTEVIPFSRERIKRALARELSRDGQAFVVHNRVRSINRVADEIRTLAPGARILVGHGQMPTKELEQVMLRFVRRQADILVCTTIIESGVDIPTANTMIITDADRFGLADLHQLRGRVGRYKHRAYCYLLLPESRTITPIAKRRLQAIEEFSMLGAGFKIAMRDLEIRGAGSILGAEQSGHIASVGYEMYCRLLEQEVKRLRSEGAREPQVAQLETVVRIGVSGVIPAAYIPSVKRRLEAYRRLAAAGTIDELNKVQRDVEQAYGKLPKATDRLMQLAELRLLAQSLSVRSLKTDGPDVVFFCDAPDRVRDALSRAKGSVRVLPPKKAGARSEVYFRPPSNHLEPATLLNILRARFTKASSSQDATSKQAAAVQRS